MRILAALTLLISTFWFGNDSSASQPEMQWEFRVDPRLLSGRGDTLGGPNLWAIYPRLNSLGSCVAAVRISASPNNPPLPATDDSFRVFVLDPDGSLRWKSPPLALQPRLVFFDSRVLVYQFPSNSPDENGATRYFCVCLNTENIQEVPASLPVSPAFQGGSTAQTLRTVGGSFLITGPTLNGPDGAYIIQKWAVPEAVPTLAPSTFGLEDGNLIISWPTAVGQTYQVQRSTDLESWENIGVALTGNGTTMNYAQPSTAEKVFLRVVVP